METARPWVYMERKERPNSPHVPDEPVSQPAIRDKALHMYWCHLGYSNPKCWMTANRWDSTYHQTNHPVVHHQLTESGKITKQLFNYSMLSSLLHSNMDNWNTIYPEAWNHLFISPLILHIEFPVPLIIPPKYFLKVLFIFPYTAAQSRLPSFPSLVLDASCSKRNNLKCKYDHSVCWPSRAFSLISTVFRIKFNPLNMAYESVQRLVPAYLPALSYVTLYSTHPWFVSVSSGCHVVSWLLAFLLVVLST